jgi:hypothetical protein
MKCPDDNWLARAQARLLTVEEAAAYQGHLDECPGCLELAMVLGCITGAAAMDPPLGNDGPRSSREVFTQPLIVGTQAANQTSARPLLVVLAMMFGHGYWSYVFVPLAWNTIDAERSSVNGAMSFLDLGFAAYTLAWAILGLGWVGVCLLAITKRTRVPRWVVSACTILSGPTVVLIPLAVCLWLMLTRSDLISPKRHALA